MKPSVQGYKRGFARAMAAVLLAVLVLGLRMPAQAEASGMIRVRLTRLGTPSSVALALEGDYVLDGDARMNLPSGSSIVVVAQGGALAVKWDGITLYCGKSLCLKRCSNAGLRFTSPSLANCFCGDLTLEASGSAVVATLRLGLEEYLYGVVGYEMSDSYPLEALKAQAVAARNYAYQKMRARASAAYDVTDNTSNQVFKGYNSAQKRVIQAVNETRGCFLFSGSAVASCYYGDSNGGQTESTQNAWGSKLAYSVVKDDPYDLSNAGAKKRTATISRYAKGLHASLEAALLDAANAQMREMGAMAGSATLLSIRSITPVDPKYAAPSRLYRALRFQLAVRGEKADGQFLFANVEVDVPTYGGIEDWYNLSINSASNETVSVEETADAFQIVFRRWGHGIGMSQRGAQAMARDHGMSCAAILDFYYPGAELRSLSLSEEGAHARLASEAAIATARLAADALLCAADGTVLAQLPRDRSVNVTDVQGARVRVDVQALDGWIDAGVIADYASIDDPMRSADEECVLAQAAELMELPHPNARALRTLEAEAEVKITACGAEWARLSCADGEAGYIRMADLRAAEPSASPAVEPTETPSAEPSASPAPEAVDTLPPLLTVSPDETLPNPFATDAPEETLFPLSTATPTALPTAAPTALPTATPRVTPLVSLPGASPAPQSTVQDEAKPTPTPAPTGLAGMKIVTDGRLAYVSVSSGSTLCLRSMPSTDAKQIDSLQSGEAVTLLAYDDSWAYVRTASGKLGFAARSYLSAAAVHPQTAEPQDDDGPGRLLEGLQEKKTDITFCNRSGMLKANAKMYKSNSSASAVLCKIPASAKVKVLAYNTDWAYISYGKYKGFVAKKLLKAV